MVTAASFHHRKMRAQYNNGGDNGGPREGSHSFNNKPATKRWPRGRN